MGNPFSSPSTDAGRTEDREESGRWPFASHDDSDRRSTAGPYSDASSSASELPGFLRISDDKDIGGRRSPVFCPYSSIHRHQHASKDDAGTSKHSLSPCNA